MPDDLSQPIPPIPSASTPMLPVSPPPITTPPTTGGSKKFKIGLAILILFLIGVSIPAAVWLTSQRQEVRKEAQGQVCCRIMAKNLCGAANGWDQVASFATEAECDAYLQNPPAFSYSCNCDEHCYTEMGHDPNQICTTGMPENIEKGKSRCTTSNSADFRKEIVNQAACAGPTATPTIPASTPTPTGTPQPLATPTPMPSVSPTPTPTQSSYTASCLTSRVYDTNWNQIINLASIQLNQTVYLVTRGSTTGGTISKARFRINGGAWQETPNKKMISTTEFFYIQYTFPLARSYTIESMVYNSATGEWY